MPAASGAKSVTSSSSKIISVSVVSHGQAAITQDLLEDFERMAIPGIEVLFTINIPEALPFDPGAFKFPIKVIRNVTPRGFGANHNAAYQQCNGSHFCVLNPDVRLTENPFPVLLNVLQASNVGVVAPLITDASGVIEDSARKFPTPKKILAKALGRLPKHDYEVTKELIHPDWIAGVFMLFPSRTYAQVGGFDERYFLYYEDVDLCARLRLLGYEIVMCPTVRVIHNARRSSRRSLRYMRWHLASMLTFFTSAVFRSILRRRVLPQTKAL